MADQNDHDIAENQIEQLKGIERRRVMRRASVGLGVAALAAAGAIGTSTPANATNQGAGASDVDILNFALNLEYLEAEFYLYATTGQGLPASLRTGTGTQGTTGRGELVPFKNAMVSSIANRLAQDELNHVTFLRSALGSAAVAIPFIDVGVGVNNAFSVLATAAGITPAGTVFDPYTSDLNFLLGASVFEDVGVTAYAGAAQYIGTPGYVAAAGSILAVEAYHAGAIRAVLSQMGASSTFAQISALRGTLSAAGVAGAQAEQPIVTANNAYNIAATDSQSLAFRRNPRQVLNIVYGAVNASKGLFFPQGLNGNITA